MALRGELITSPIWEVLQLLYSGQKTGKLLLEYQNQTLIIFLERGNIINISNQLTQGDKLLPNIALYTKGNFTFIPENIKIPQIFSLSPLDILISTAPITEEYEYLENYVFIPIEDSNTKEEKIILENLGKFRKIKEVLLLSGIPAKDFLEIFNKLLTEKKIIEIKNDYKMLLIYIFYNHWKHLLSELHKKGVNERNLRGGFQEFLYSKNTKICDLYNEITENDGLRLWIFIYKNINKFSEEEIKKFNKEALQVIWGFYKEDLSLSSNLVKSNFVNDEIYIPIKEGKSFEEQIILDLLDGDLKIYDLKELNILKENILEDTLNKLIQNNSLIKIDENQNLFAIKDMLSFLNNTKEKNRYNIENISKIDILPIRFLIKYLYIYNLKPSWKYLYHKLSDYSQEKLKEIIQKYILGEE